VPAYPARETRKAYSVSRVWANAGGLDVTCALLGRQRAEASALPNWVKPQLTKLVDQPSDGPEWLHEIKFDGYRMHARLDRGAARLLTRTGLDWTHKYPATADSGGKRLKPGKRDRARQAKNAPAAGAERRVRGSQQMPGVSLSDATLKAVQAHDEGATASEVLNYLSRQFGMTVRPNHLGKALQRHRRAGQLENRDQRWYLPPSA
jgi:hypothetical protein